MNKQQFFEYMNEYFQSKSNQLEIEFISNSNDSNCGYHLEEYDS